MAVSVEISDAVFCQEHIAEVCEECDADFREENDAFYGFDPIDRDALPSPSASANDDGVYLCDTHKNSICNQCFSWKKQLVRLHKEAKKRGS
ncbi:hypothetical protein FPOAC2_10060 [Fusarium poae]|uniref:Uncharacterized protein n=1 Tax=Fusarium poae TaxID=36050 RepID=A0A1B8AQY2_FUSPO|nr:hypothetical protein FPOAC1_007558 [Fusarium poae]KAG8668181.1 hypothetical protein FPOAC1_007558 [Fusarium poae]OBS22890.1 hypothetical protein FPOA_09213 [Fusarium poae]